MRRLVFFLILGIYIISVIAIASCNGASENEITDFANMIRNQDEYKDIHSWSLPDFVGWSCMEVANVLSSIGQEYEIIFVDDEKSSVNCILNQYPASGEIIKKEETITLEANDYYVKSSAVHFPFSYTNPIMEMGEWIYFTDGKTVFKSNADYGNTETLYSTYNPSENIVTIIPRIGAVLFLTENDDDNFCLYSVEQDTMICEKIYEMEYCIDIFTNGDILYLYCGDYVFQYDILKESISINENIPSFSFIQYNGYRYYFEVNEKKETNLCREDNNGSSNKLLQLDKYVYSYCLYDDNFYFVGTKEDEGGYSEWLYKYSLETQKCYIIGKIGNEKGMSDIYRFFIWREKVFAVNHDRIIEINTVENIYSEIKMRVPDELRNNTCVLCGNYIYWYSPYPDGMALKDGRYNLLTKEYEEFEWDNITG